MKKKVAFCTYDAPFFHGPNTWLKRLLPALRDNNFEIELLFFFEGDLNKCDTYQFFKNLGCRVETFPFKTIAEKKVLWILEMLSADPPDIFVPHMLVHAFYAANWIKKAGIPTIGVIHSDEKFYDGIIDVFINGSDAFRISAAVAVSEHLFNKVNTQKPAHVVTKCIPCGVTFPKITAVCFDKPVLSLIYVGRLTEKQKRISAVVKAMCKASNEIEGVTGIIYGHGDDNKVKKIIKKYSSIDKVKFGGALANEEVFSKLSEAQVFILLSDYEGLPQSLLEAMSCGLVPVCTDIKSGIPELITTNETGIIVKNRNLDFIKAVKRLKNDRDLCEKISKKAMERVKNYSAEVCITSWINLLNELQPSPNISKKIEIPVKIELPKRHPQLSTEDFRIPTAFDLLLEKIRKTKAFRYFKKSILNR
jgi:colanic acid/amylovoran biosynthesis glycosyltransferase